MSGFSDAGLDRLSQGLADQVERGVVAGLTALVARGDAVHVVTAGLSDLDARVPMRRDSLFRIASMTKPITAAAALMLVEAGLLQLDAPIEHWLPELADRRVLRRLDGPLDDTVPAKRSITLRDLLNFSFGLGVLVMPGNPPIRQPGSGRQDTPSDDGYGGYDALQPPADRHEDASHQADRRRTTELNQRAYAHPNAGGSQSDYAQQSAQYRAELDDHAHAMQDYQAARARYAERIARWRARADACEAGHLDACEGPE